MGIFTASYSAYLALICSNAQKLHLYIFQAYLKLSSYVEQVWVNGCLQAIPHDMLGGICKPSTRIINVLRRIYSGY